MPMGSSGVRSENSSKDGEPDPGGLQWAISAALTAAGARVVISPTVDNLVRRADPGEGGSFVVEAQGLENLIHEFVHVVLFGRLEDDHGIDYQAIPFDLESERGRSVLFDELACALWSCAWMAGTPAQRQAWFAEQLSIQPIFYGFEHAPLPEFVRAVDRVRVEHEAELGAVLRRARDEAILWLGEAAVPTHPVMPEVSLRFGQLVAELSGQVGCHAAKPDRH